MKSSKLFSLAAKVKNLKVSMSINNVTNKKLDHYRNLNAISNNQSPADWDSAKPFESIPGPRPLPVIGNSWRFFLPKIGDFYGLDFLEIFQSLHNQHGHIAILKGLLGIQPMVILFSPKDIEKLHRNEGVWPIREGLQSFTHYQKMRTNRTTGMGLVTLQGEEWFNFRTVVNPILMHPKNITQYTEKMNLVTQEFIDNIRFLSQQNEDGQMPDNFIDEIHKWSLELVCLVAMDTRLGCLERESNENSEPRQLVRNVERMFQLMYKLDFMPSLWKIFSTPTWKKYVKVLDFLWETNLKYINQHLEKVEKGEILDQGSVLDKMVKIDKNIAMAMAVDMMIAGVDTTGRVLGAALYYLSKNVDKQVTLRDEAFTLLPTKNSPVTKEALTKNTYTKAVIKETTRLSPISIGNMRTLPKNLVLGGYQIPTGTNIITSTLLLSKQDQYFYRAKEFLPERWLPTTVGELSHKNSNRFAYAPFGFGPRGCIGKRLANLELEIALLKIIRNFELKWLHEDMVFATNTLHGIARPLKLHIKDIKY